MGLAFLTWSVAAWANAATFSDELLGIPGAAWLLAGAIAMLGGVTKIIMQLAKVPPQIELKPRPIFGAMWSSMMGGAIGFLIGLGAELVPAYVAVVTFALAMAGTAAIEGIRDRGLAIIQGAAAPKN